MNKLLLHSKVMAIAITASLCISTWENTAAGAGISHYNHWQQATPVKSILDAIAAHYKVNLVYEDRLVKGRYSAYLFVPGQNPVQKVLQELLTPLGLKASKLNDKNFTITTVKRVRNAAGATTDAAETTNTTAAVSSDTIIKPLAASQQPIDTSVTGKTIRGRIISANGEGPIPGASILVRNMKLGTTSDVEGYFTLRIPGATRSITVAHVSYLPQDISPDNKNLMTIRLSPRKDQLEQVVVSTGLYKRPKENFTGAAVTVSGDDLRKVNNVSVLDALKVFDPSIRIPDNVQFGSDPNRLPIITMRGTNNFPQQTTGSAAPVSGADFMANYSNNPNQPLFILDGFEVSLQKIYDLDINRIASFTILKDAAATSMYGSKAANGVIVIETRQPLPGKLRVNYSGMVQVAAPDLTVYDLTNAAEKLEVERLAGVYSAYSSGIRPDADAVLRARYASRMAVIQKGVNTYWLNKPVRTGMGQRHSIYLEGGDAIIRYGIDMMYNNNSGVMKNSNRDNYTGGMNFSYRHKGLLFKNILSVAFNKSRNSNYGSFTDYTKQNQYWNPYDSTGHLARILEAVKDPLNGGSANYFNPLYNASLNTIDQAQYSNVINQTNIEWLLGKGLRLTGRLQLTKQHDESDYFLPANHTSFDTVTSITRKGIYTKGEGNFFSYDGTIQLDYSKRLGKHLILNSTGSSISQTNSDYMTVTATGFPNERLDQINFGNNYQENSKPTYTNNTTRLISAYTNFNYSYDNRYAADFSIRSDGSSQFGTDKRFGTFWSAGVSWNLHREKILADKSYINMLRLRSSIGTTGDSRFQSFMGITTYQYYTDQNYRGLVGSILKGYGNSNLQWQNTFKRNIGLDLGLFKDRILINFDVYRENTTKLILDINTPPSDGFSSYKENAGELENRGYEFKLNVFVIKNEKKQIYWNIFGNGLHNQDHIKSISNSLKKLNQLNDANSTTTTSADYNKQAKPQFRFQEGMSVNAIWAVRSLGIDPSTGREVFLKRDGTQTYVWDANDKMPVGNTVPDLRGSFGTNVTWKGISLAVYFSYELGGDMYNQTLVDRVEVTDFTYNVDRRVLLGRWAKPGDVTYFKGLINDYGNPVTTATYVTSRFVQKNNFVNAESISLSYQLPDKLNRQLKLSNTKFTFIVNDLKRWSGIQVERGLDYPFARNLTLNVSTSL
ncbi:SusC/RagA family TonB-linked outer membrane protein [Niastella koreensis]|uniref:TonB-dependent receptor plug n=2 Tax=Niastella koreensis TaxID=354356 RepID=G8TJ63_NIAKG|nr:SusC/RagA family TonB-linked outer membrane protein [Niastella koreensis]AEV98596.1 TonB-dependent receptor plug [Niastella koreensis GR20-10]OQP52964.1 SusC/RagA family TonB-linked outer membrane protein [Niastella koreensis]